MPHTVWNLGAQTATARIQPREFVAGVKPAQNVFIGRSREPKNMILIMDAWIEVNVFTVDHTNLDEHSLKIALALGKVPLVAALLLPVGRVSISVSDAGVGATDQPATASTTLVEQLFKAQGTMWAAQSIAIDVIEQGVVTEGDVDVHMDWTVVPTDWFTWFVSWNELEAAPDGSLVDGERAYA